MTFRHYICTRYNTGLYSTNVYKVEDPDKWMKERIKLYKSHVFGLRDQTNQNFHYLCFMDEKTPKKYIKEVRNLLLNFLGNSFLIVLDVPFNHFKELKVTTDYIITSRIDNDDFYLKDFVKSIQSNFKGKEEVLDVVGYQLSLNNGDWYTSGRIRPNSPFISLVEKNSGDLKTVFHKPHSSMPDLFTGRFVGDDPCYVQVIHGNNLKNKIIGKKLDK
jgi:hypothetical protein